ncbi:cysteine-rich CWC family protein [Oleiharenicola lentus]|uniref:cysteine-rich CWC family protein n=1 Tax=Oleiharenicola lentus TaxID=2508720 RepID=UPI003F67E110
MDCSEDICPLCQQPNACGRDADPECWCHRDTFPPELRARVPASLRDKSCICRACLLAHEAGSLRKDAP